MKVKYVCVLALGTVLCALPILTAQVSSKGAAETYKVDPVHSGVIFKIKHLDVSYFYGRFNEVSGKFTIDEADPASNTFDVEIKTDSIDTNSENRDRHLKGPDFFNAKQYPKVIFQSTSVKKIGDRLYEVTGNLTLHGVTQPLTVKLEHTGSGSGSRGEYRIGFETTFNIKRSDFDMKYALGNLGDEVKMMVSLEGIKQ